MTHRLILCSSCPAGGSLRRALANTLTGYSLTDTDCMSGCTRPSTAAFRAPGKTAYLFGDLDDTDLPDLITFARLYLASPDGTFADARPLGRLRTKAIARIPG
jgi:predicted metal-binding protein